MEQFIYKTKGVCSSAIEICIDDNRIHSVKYHGGCAGNTQGVAALIAGMQIEEAINRLSGIKCGFKSTSCPDQLSLALREYLASK